MFRRLLDLDDVWWGRMADGLLSWCRLPRRKSFTLDREQLFAFRSNVGYAGKKELERIAKATEDMHGLMRHRENEIRNRRLIREERAQSELGEDG